MATATNKRPTPAKSPAQLKTAPKAAPTATEDDLEDDLDGDDGAGNSDRNSFQRLPKHVQLVVRLNNGAQRLTKYVDKVMGWSADEAGLVIKAQDALRAALTSLKTASESIEALPDDYKSRAPKTRGRKVGSKVELLPGSIVRITDKAKAEYEGLDFELTGIEVIEVRGNKVICKTSDGMRAMIGRGHVCPDVG